MNRNHRRLWIPVLGLLVLMSLGTVAGASGLLQIDPTQQQGTVDAAVEHLFTATAEAHITATIDAAFKQAVVGTAAALATPTPTATFTPEAFQVDQLTVQQVHTLDLLAGPTRTGAYLAPDGEHFAYLKGDQICIYTTAGVEQKCIPFDPQFRGLDPESIHWSPDSRYIVLTSDFLRFFVESDLFVIDTVDGTMRNVTNDLVLKFDIGKMDEFSGWIDLAPRWFGEMIYFLRYTQSAGVFAPPSLWRVQADGKNAEKVGTFSTLDRFSIYAFAISPDGTQVAYNFYSASADDRRNGIWLSNLNGSNAQQLYHAEEPQFVPFTLDFSPDSRYLLAVTGAAGMFGAEAKPEDSPVYALSVSDGTKRLIDPSAYVFSAGWSPTGSALVFTTHDYLNPDNSGVFVTDAPGGEAKLLQNGAFIAATPRITQTLSWTMNNVILVSNSPQPQMTIFELSQ